MREMEKKLRTAGVDVPNARLSTLAFDSLRDANGDARKAARAFERAVRKDPELLIALWVEPAFVARCERYLTDRAADMTYTSSTRGESQRCAESHESPAPPRAPSSSGGASHLQRDSHRAADRAAAGPSEMPTVAASLVAGDRHGNSDRRNSPAPTRIDKGAARAVARSSVFDMHIGSDVVFGDLTYRAWLSVAPKFAAAAEFAKQMYALKWKSLDRPIRDWLPEDEGRALIESVMRAREAAAVAARSLSHAR